MSVATYNQEDWQKLFNTLKAQALRRSIPSINPFHTYLVRTTAQLYYKGDEEKAITAEVCRFVKLLYYSNELTCAYTYELDQGMPSTITPLELNDEAFGDQYSIPDLVKFLGLVGYNCISQGGTEFMPASAKETLQTVRQQAASIMADELNGVDHNCYE